MTQSQSFSALIASPGPSRSFIFGSERLMGVIFDFPAVHEHARRQQLRSVAADRDRLNPQNTIFS